MWAGVLFRLRGPVALEGAVALLPTDPAPVGTESLYAARPEVHTGSAPVDGAVNESLPAAEPAHSVNPLQIASAVGAAVWAAGGAGMLLAGVLALLRLRRRLRGARGAEARSGRSAAGRGAGKRGLLWRKLSSFARHDAGTHPRGGALRCKPCDPGSQEAPRPLRTWPDHPGMPGEPALAQATRLRAGAPAGVSPRRHSGV